MNKSRWLTLTLILSLATNLLIAGIFIGRSMSRGEGAIYLPPNLGWMIRHMDQPTRQALRSKIEEHSLAIKPIRQEMRKTQRAFDRLLVEPEPDVVALKETLTRLRSASDEYQRETHSVMLKLIPELNEEQRRRMSNMLRSRPDQPHRRHQN